LPQTARSNPYNKEGKTKKLASSEKELKMAQTYTDPVCGMEVTSYTAAAQSNYKGTTYYFCSRVDKEEFDKNPEKYVKPVKEPMPQR